MKQFYILSTLALFFSFSTVKAQQSCSFIIHVDGLNGNNAIDCGAEGTPCSTINWGINRAFTEGYADVRISSNVSYTEIVDLASGVNLWGGFDSQWASTGQTTIVGGMAGNGEFYTIFANGINNPTILSDLRIVAPNATTPGKSSYGVHVTNSAELRFQRVTVEGGAGSDGTLGVAGIDATTGAINGSPGGSADEFNTSCNDDQSGGGGAGATTPGYPNTAGGSGGRGGYMDDDCSGFPDLDATGGISGNSAIISTINSFGYRGAGGGTCNPGQAGLDGQTVHGTGGAGATTSVNVVGFFWQSTAAVDGTLGLNGTGGGGGGGSGGCDSGTDSYGAGGGGGGSGGIAASSAGTGGLSGGNSAAVFMMNSTCSFVDCHIELGSGGSGGNGGNGGQGTAGGQGGPAGPGDGDSGPGGAGGAGGAGGNSGGGGGGAGGSAYGIFANGSTVNRSGTTFDGGTTGVIGTGGAGSIAGGNGLQGTTAEVGGNVTDNVVVLALEEDPCTEITTVDLAIVQFCAGETTTVDYTVVGSFSGTNTFTAELSDPTGDFTNPTDIGSIVSTTSGTITVVIPTNALSGTAYRIRVVSTATPAIGSLNATDIIINPLPVVTITAPTTTVCEGGEVTLSGNGADLLNWNNGVLDGVAFMPTETAYYTVTGTASATNCTNMDSVLITVLELPDTSVVQNGAELAAVLAGATYQWVDCDDNYSALPGAEAQVYTATASGNYAVVVTMDGCADTSSCYNILFVDVEAAEEKEHTLVVYPNPSTGVFQFISDIQTPMEVSIFNAMGKMVYSQANVMSTTPIDLRGAANGLYSIRFYNKELNLLRQVIIQK